jgi:prevent-host-death family protein
MRITRDIQSLSDFKQNASKLVKQVRLTKEPLVLTVNGKAAVVIQDAESYQTMIDRGEYSETVAALRVALADIENSDQWPTTEEVFSELRAELGILNAG